MFYPPNMVPVILPLVIRKTRITRMMVGFIGKFEVASSSKIIPATDRTTISMSKQFHLEIKTKQFVIIGIE